MDPLSQNIEGPRQLIASGLNKVPFDGLKEGTIDNEREDVLTLKLDNSELIKLSDQLEDKYKPYSGKIDPRQKNIKSFYLGLQREGGSTVAGEPISSNLLFEAEETFLPAALAKNPEPVVWSDNSEEGEELSKTVKTMLQYHADTLNLRGALKLMTRQWSIYLLGVVKHGWDDKIQDIKLDTRKIQNFIFDPEGFINRFGDYEGLLGERIKTTAEDLADMFPDHRAYIVVQVDGKMGTPVVYTEWWSDEYSFCRFKNIILDKTMNPYFNYDDVKHEIDIDGEKQKVTTPARNHFGRPKKPYTFLSVFSLEEHPHDMTSLIEQNIPNQRRITRRTDQIDYNLSRSNNSDVFSENNFTQETAKQAAGALAKGNPIIVPKGGPIEAAIHRLQAPGLDAAFFTELETSKQDLRQIFGTQGITSDPTSAQDTVRGKIIDQQHDSTRIGGGVGDSLEQVADNVFNWWAQLYHVFYDEPHIAAIVGQMKSTEYVTLKSKDLNRRLVVSVSPNSMKPKDEITKMNQAMDLYEAGALDPKTLLTMLDFPDPQKTAENSVLWKVDPQAYIQLNFPELAQQLQQIQQQAALTAQSTGQAPGGGMIPNESPEGELSAPPADENLNQIPINNPGTPQ